MFALSVVADVRCRFFFSFGVADFFCTYLLLVFTPEYCFFTWSHPPTYTHPPTLQGFCADAHRFTLKCWWVVGGVGWITFRDSPYESDSILVTPGKSKNTLSFDFVHNPVWELHTSAATPPSLMLSVASTTNLIGHNIFTSFVDRHKT